MTTKVKAPDLFQKMLKTLDNEHRVRLSQFGMGQNPLLHRCHYHFTQADGSIEVYDGADRRHDKLIETIKPSAPQPR